MKSRTLSSDLTILKKDITRSAPVWLTMCVILLIRWYGIVTPQPSYQDYEDSFSTGMALFFGPILALTLFGYLCKPSECFMVHSLPIRRERLLLLHTIAGFLVYLIPMGLSIAGTRGLYAEEDLARLGWCALEFALFFGTGVLCMLLTGRKLGAALLYILLEDLNGLIVAVLQTIYVPMLPGVYLNTDMFYLNSTAVITEIRYEYITGTKVGWLVAIVCAVTLAVYGAALILYRRRDLEHAGDLVSVRWLDPVFAAISGFVGVFILEAFVSITVDGVPVPVLVLGLAMGYQAYHMLSARSARVFTKKILTGLVCLTVLVVGSVYVTGLDPFGRVHHIPDTGEIESVRFSENVYAADRYTTADPEQIAALTALHQDLLEQMEENSGLPDYEGDNVFLEYTLKNGKTVQRQYVIHDDAVADQAAYFLSQPIALFGKDDPVIYSVEVRKYGTEIESALPMKDSFLEVFLDDCRNGRMFSFGYEDNSDWDVVLYGPRGRSAYIDIPLTAQNTIAWLEEHCSATK